MIYAIYKIFEQTYVPQNVALHESVRKFAEENCEYYVTEHSLLSFYMTKEAMALLEMKYPNHDCVSLTVRLGIDDEDSN